MFIFLDIFFIGLISTKYFGKLLTYHVIHKFANPPLPFSGVFLMMKSYIPPEVSRYQVLSQTILPRNSSMDKKDPNQSRSDKFQEQHNQVKEKTTHKCTQPCAICCLFLPGQNYINQQKKKEDDKN